MERGTETEEQPPDGCGHLLPLLNAALLENLPCKVMHFSRYPLCEVISYSVRSIAQPRWPRKHLLFPFGRHIQLHILVMHGSQ